MGISVYTGLSGQLWAGALRPSAMARRTTGATAPSQMPRERQYLDCSHFSSGFAPLLALQPIQQRAIFCRVTILASLTMCSQDGRFRRSVESGRNSTPQ